jgi:membrane-associated phospholipid phosphatase
MRHIILFLLFLLSVPDCESSVFAQNPAVRDSADSNKYNFTQFGNETWNFVKQPAKWDGSDLLRIGLISAGTIVIMESADRPIRDAVIQDQRYSTSVPIEFGRIWGEFYTPFVFFGGFAVHSLFTNNAGTRKIAFEIGQASLYAGAVNYILKLAIGRARPYMDEGSMTFHPFSSFFNEDYHSIPGGHATAAFAVSTVLSRNAKPVWLKIIAYVPAALTFISRIYQNQHWTSDDFLGAAFGYGIATWVVDQHEPGTDRIRVTSTNPCMLTVTIVLN